MTLKEILLVLENNRKQEEARAREKTSLLYAQARLTAEFVGFMLNGKNIPALENIFPEVVEISEEEKAKREQQAWQFNKEQMLAFATEHNKRRKQNK